MAKHKGKRTKSGRDSAEPGVRSVSATRPGIGAPAQPGTASTRPEVVEGLRVEGNVIHLPKPGGAEDNPRTTMRAGTGWAGSEPSAEENPLRSDEGEAERNTVPPEASDADASEVSGEVLAPATSTDASAKADPEGRDSEGLVKGAPPPVEAAPPLDAPPAEALEAKKADDKKADDKKADDKKADDKKADDKKDVVVGRGERRDRKESLSTHLSDEARAFFSDKSLDAAYKPHHDNFEDLTPAHEDHAQEVARSRKWMRVTGMMLIGVVAVVGAFALQSKYGVQETEIRTPQFHPEPRPPSPAPSAATAAASEPAPAPAPPQAEPSLPSTTAAGDASVVPAEPVAAAAPEAGMAATAPAQAAPTEPTPTAPPTEPTPTAAAMTAPAPAPPAVVAPSPAGGDPAALLSAARRSGSVEAWEAYFDAAPTEDRLMASTAMAMAERGRNAQAERLAQRAVTANPQNGQAWFVLAVVRGAQRNGEGAREAKQRCIAIGGRWATECRGI